jgi:hypothetical protein
MGKRVTTTNGKAEYGVVYKIRGCLGERLLLTLNRKNGDLYYIHNGIRDNIKYMKLSDVVNDLHRSCHDNDYGKVMTPYCVLNG